MLASILVEVDSGLVMRLFGYVSYGFRAGGRRGRADKKGAMYATRSRIIEPIFVVVMAGGVGAEKGVVVVEVEMSKN